MTSRSAEPVASIWRAGLLARCPGCGQGRLFSGFLTLDHACGICGLDYSFADAGDGPAVFIILVVGFLVTGGALLTEALYSPPYWVHALIWIPACVALPLLLLRPFKATMIGLQYRHRAGEGRPG
jgi:uncharacterized protein (DUF983 family)